MLEHLTVPIQWKAGGDAGTLEGYASTFGNADLGGDVVVKGAFIKTIANIKKNGIPLLADHVASTASVLGTIFDAEEDAKGLKIKARFSSAPSAQDVRTKLLEGHLDRMSIGYEPVEYAFADAEDGRRLRKLIEIKLWETSVVVFPMNPEAAATRVKSLLGSLDEPMRAAVIAALSVKDDTNTLPPAAAGGSPADEAEAKATDEAATGNTNTAQADEAGSAPDEGAAGWDRWKSEAILAGRDPDATTDSATRAGLQTTLELMEASMGRKEG
jgi:HK97 family phage prohead protease